MIRWHKAYDYILFAVAIAVVAYIIFDHNRPAKSAPVRQPALILVCGTPPYYLSAAGYPVATNPPKGACSARNHKNEFGHRKEKTFTGHGRYAKGVPFNPR